MKQRRTVAPAAEPDPGSARSWSGLVGPGGLVALWMPGSLTFISPERAGLNALIIKSLQSVFGNVRIIPGDYNIYCASDDPRLLRIQGSDVARAFRESGIETAIDHRVR